MSVTVKDPTALRGDPDRTSIGGIVQLLRGLYTFTDGADFLTLGAGMKANFFHPTDVAPATPIKGRLYESLVCRGWVNFKDVGGTITINAAVNCTVGFRTGTATGDYTLTLTTANADANWVAVGMARESAGVTVVVVANATNILHTAAQLNFTINETSTGGLRRPSECTLVVFGN